MSGDPLDWSPWRNAPPAEYGVVGDPVSHSLSPKMHRAAYLALRLPTRYQAVQVSHGEFNQAVGHLKTLGYKGLNVTVPHKATALDWCKWTNAERMGAVNTLDLLHEGGINTDAPGFLGTLVEAKIKPCEVLVLGAGGSARALCVALHETGYGVKIFNRTFERAHQMVKDCNLDVQILSVPDATGCQLIVNTTSAGLQGIAPDLDWSTVASSTFAYDLYYSTGPTPFLEVAMEHGLRTMDGKRLLVAQGALSFEWWTGIKAPREVMMAAVS